MAATRIAIAHAAEPLDALLWRVLGGAPGPSIGTVEAVLAANPGLAAVALALPGGYEVQIPIATAAPVKTAPLVQLWD